MNDNWLCKQHGQNTLDEHGSKTVPIDLQYPAVTESAFTRYGSDQTCALRSVLFNQV